MSVVPIGAQPVSNLLSFLLRSDPLRKREGANFGNPTFGPGESDRAGFKNIGFKGKRPDFLSFDCKVSRTPSDPSSLQLPMASLGQHLEDLKEHWCRNFAFLDYYKKRYGRKQPLPKWTDADVQEFIATDPVYGPQLKALRESRTYVAAGALLGAAHLGGVSLKYSKSPHGFVLASGFGALCGGMLGSEVAEHWKQLYNIDKQGANLRFLYWWEDKTLGNQRK